MIYNGDDNWTEKRSLLDHFAFYNDELLKYIPVFEYILIDIARFDDKLLEKLKGAASTFFLLDKTDLTQRVESGKRIVGILKELIHSNAEIYNLLGRYISELLQYKGIEIPVINEYINDRGESMLAQSMDKLYEQGIEQGIDQGIEQERSFQEKLRKQEKMETTRKMLAEGLDIKMISNISGLSISEIKELEKNTTP